MVFINWQILSPISIKTGDAEKTVFASYLETSAAHQRATAISTKKKIIEMKPSKAAISQRETIAGERISPLLTLLHAAIQHAERYPASAAEMGREGRATVGFILHPDGSISELKLLHSSGTNSLDNAALAAVNDATPFQQIDHYLKAAQAYQLDVVFLL